MKALSVREPWAWLLFGPKDVENRDWPLPRDIYGQEVYIHASMRMDDVTIDELRSMMTPEEWEACHTALGEIYSDWRQFKDHPEELRRRHYFGCLLGTLRFVAEVADSPSPWFKGRYGFLRSEPVLFPPEKRVVCRGQLGFFEARL